MAKLLLILTCVLSLNYQVQSQIIRSPLSLLNRPYTETVIDATRNYIEVPIEASRNYMNVPRIYEAPRNYLQPQPSIIEPPCSGTVPFNIPGIPSIAPTTIITDCTPSVCKNLADTINLMIVSNLLQNSKAGDQAVMQLAAPLLKGIMANPALAGYPNSISDLVNPNFIAPNVVAPNYLAQNFFTPNLEGSNLYVPNSVAPRLVIPNSIAPGSNSVSPNAPKYNSALLSSIINLLGGSL